MQARVDLLSESLSKSGKNKFAGYSYFELGDFLPQIQKIFFRIGLCGYVSFAKELATLTITDVHDQTEIVITSPMADANLKGVHPIQNLGAVETYNRRYLWMAALELVEFDALDASKPLEGKPPEAKQVPIITPNGGARELVTEDDMIELVELAEILKDAVADDPVKAREMVISANLFEPQKLALWTLLDSKTRAALKKKD
tara:strand:- start:583 stop:1185 length:603 start_codon:yes stop_codon:yes gene_type:complete